MGDNNKDCTACAEVLTKRTIEVEVTEEDANLRLKGKLVDLKRGLPHHGINVDMLVSVMNGEILEISGEAYEHPLPDCARAPESLELLKGELIGRGYTKMVYRTVGSNIGCKHLAALLLSMGNTFMQASISFVQKHFPDKKMLGEIYKANSDRVGFQDSCIAWREGGDATKLYDPETGELEYNF